MNLEIYGQDGEPVSAHGEYELGVDPALEPCPFCASDDIEVSNTHTAYYGGSCQQCGAEGPRQMADGYDGSHIYSRTEAERLHRNAFQKAIEAWNNRAA